MSEHASTPVIEEGFERARRITGEYAKTFYFASRFLPEDKRRAAYAVYALCRLSDETVDAAGQDTAAAEASLERLRAEIRSAYANADLSEPLLAAFRATVRAYDIPPEYFEELISGMRMDLVKDRYENFEELYDYCYKAAGVVGLIMLRIFGSNHPHAQQHAVSLGIAMQLTNIARDIKEDFARQRVYIPGDELRHYGVSFNQIKEGRMSDRMKKLLRMQITRARQFYLKSRPGLPMITDGRCRFVACLMKELYAGICDEIERADYDIFTRRAHVSMGRKLFLTAQMILRGDLA